MNVILVTHGTAGDVLPFVGLGKRLAARGHRVTLLANAHFQSLADDGGLDFVPIGTEEDFRKPFEDPSIWKPSRGVETLGRQMAECMRPQYQAILERYVPGETVVAASGAAFGARIAQDKLGAPTATIALQPAVFRSVFRTPVVAGLPRAAVRLPRFAKRLAFRAVDIIGDRIFRAAEINAFRGELGLQPVRHVIRDWWLSPQRVIGLFPAWYAPPQPDWPAQTRLTGFPLYDQSTESEPLPKLAEAFLSAGDKPIVFTPGSAMMHGQGFCDAIVHACRALGRRGLLLSRHGKDWLGAPTDSVAYFDYLPLSLVLPRAAALVHHGGIGTLSQGLRAGIPQLIMPMMVDQPDNGEHLRRLGLGDWVDPKSFRGPAVTRALRHLLGSSEVAQQCSVVADRFQGRHPLEDTCDLLEQLGNTRPSES